MKNTYESERIHRFTSIPGVIEALPEMGPFYLQARSRGGGIGKRIEAFRPVLVPELDFACDPDLGIGFAFNGLVAIHAGTINAGSLLADALDFEFAGFPGGLSFHKFPDMDQTAAIQSLIQKMPCEAIPSEELISWRLEQASEIEMCACCELRAEARAKHPERHPLYAILRQAEQSSTTLEFRLSAEHVDMTSSFIPHRITARNGFLVLTDALSLNAFHVDMRMVHAITIDVTPLDGLPYSTLHIYDMAGILNFHLLTEGFHHAAIWRDLCEGLRDGTLRDY